MNDELDPEVFGDLPEPEQELETAPSEVQEDVEEEFAPQYPFIQGLGGNEEVGTYLCHDAFSEGRQVVQKMVNEALSREVIDLVDYGFSRLQGLAHPSLALVKDYGFDGDQAFLVREYISGKPLMDSLGSYRQEQILHLFYQILEALDYLYTQNVLHLHLSPGNLFLISDPSGNLPRVKISDFGLGILLDRKKAGDTNAVGQAPYTAPEYALNPFPDTKADLYSFGVLLYQALSKQLPFAGEDPVALLQSQLKSEPKPLSQTITVDVKLSDFVSRLLLRDPKSRFRDPREALKALVGILGGYPKGGLIPPAFSDPDEAFRFKRFAKMFRRILLQGRRWAFEAPRGSGKTYFAHWIQRYFWINRKEVRLYRGSELPFLQGEMILNPKEPFYVVIDDANSGTVSAWLEARPYLHVVILGEDLGWAKADPRWQFFPLEDLKLEEMKGLYQSEWGVQEERIIQALAKETQGKPGRMVEQGRALQRLGILQATATGWKVQDEKLIRSLGLGKTISSLDASFRPLVSLLALSEAPLNLETLTQWFPQNVDHLYSNLVRWVRDEVLRRHLWVGQEYFSSGIPPPNRLDSSVTEALIQEWAKQLGEIDRAGASFRLLNRCVSATRLEANAELKLLKGLMASGAGRHQEAFRIFSGPFVKGLPPQQQGRALAALGNSLLSSDRMPQAESAFKNSFTYFRNDKNLPGQARVLKGLGVLAAASEDQGKAIKYFEQALSFAEKCPEDPILYGEIELDLARFYEEATDFSHAQERYHHCIELFNDHQRYGFLASAYQSYAGLSLKQGEEAQGEFYAREALHMAQFWEQPWVAGQALIHLYQLEEMRGNPGLAMQRLGEAVAVMKELENPRTYADALILRAYFFETNRQLDRAHQDAEEVLRMGTERKDTDLIGRAHLVKGKILRRDIEKLDEAYQHFNSAGEAFKKSHNLKYAWEPEFEKGEIERNRNDSQAARPHYETALRLIDEYIGQVSPATQEAFLKDGKRDQIQMAIKWLE